MPWRARVDVTPRRAVLGVAGIAALGFGAGSLMRRFGPARAVAAGLAAGTGAAAGRAAAGRRGVAAGRPTRWPARRSSSTASPPGACRVWPSIRCCWRCAREHRLPFVGIAWNDPREPALAWLRRNGNPFDTVLHDPDGRIAAPWAIPGVPATLRRRRRPATDAPAPHRRTARRPRRRRMPAAAARSWASRLRRAGARLASASRRRERRREHRGAARPSATTPRPGARGRARQDQRSTRRHRSVCP
ncbi:MAG: hypothetical protein MZW92_66550 [Comamonadaceae bacterium]|nr:hypothetical protein [Comamonadaceae bacterium]